MKAMAMLANQFFFFFSLLIPFALYSSAVCVIYMYTFIYLVGSLAVAFALALTT